MTNKEALECFEGDCALCQQREVCKKLQKTGNSPCRNINAISALRAQEKEPCEYCKNETVHFVSDYEGRDTQKIENNINIVTGTSAMAILVPVFKANFCPMCGRQLKGE